MKKVFLATIISILVVSAFSCNSQSKTDAKKQAVNITSMVQANSPGYTPASTNYYIKAKINGKDWAADEFLVDDGGGIAAQTKEGEHFNLPYELRYAKEGRITNLKNNVSNIYMNDDIKMWNGNQGEMMYTKVGDDYAEGKFYISATDISTGKQLKITDGVFRIPLTRK